MKIVTSLLTMIVATFWLFGCASPIPQDMPKPSSTVEQINNGGEKLRLQLASDIEDKLGLYVECQRSIPNRLSELSLLINHLNQLIVKNQSTVDHEIEQIKSNDSSEFFVDS